MLVYGSKGFRVQHRLLATRVTVSSQPSALSPSAAFKPASLVAESWFPARHLFVKAANAPIGGCSSDTGTKRGAGEDHVNPNFSAGGVKMEQLESKGFWIPVVSNACLAAVGHGLVKTVSSISSVRVARGLLTLASAS